MNRSREDTEENEKDPEDKSYGEEAEENEDEEQEVEEEDENPPSPVQCWDEAVDITPTLIRDVRILWKHYGGDRKTAKSFWLDADVNARCQIEAMALSIADFHLEGSKYAGVEVWTQLRDTDQPGLGFHFDKDEKKAAEEKIWKHPVVGTATYLTTGGAPLVVFATVSEEGSERHEQNSDDNPIVLPENPSKKAKHEDDETEKETKEATTGPSHAWICYPEEGRHVAFAGDFLHGVPEELVFEKQNTDRVSLLVNIWLDHKPDGIEPLSSDTLQKMSGSSEDTCFLLEEQSVGELDARRVPLQPIELDLVEPLVPLREHTSGDTAPIPIDSVKDLVETREDPPFIQISY